MTLLLGDGYTAEIDSVDSAAWCELLSAFSDANLYQAWQHESLVRHFEDVSRVVVRHGPDVVAAAEIRLFVLPLTRSGIAYIRWGPMWRRRGAPENVEHFRYALRALRSEYVERRGMVLRLAPRLFVENHCAPLAILQSEGFSPVPDSPIEMTLLVDLTSPLDGLRAGFEKKWRNCLSKAERAGLTISEGSSGELFDDFDRLYAAMIARKQFRPVADLQRHRRLLAALPEHLKMGVVVARHEGEACAAAIYSAMGDTGIYLFGATNETGMKTSGAYLVQWELLKLLKQSGISQYDLHGINPKSNPGTYHFKKGLAGKNGKEVTFVRSSQAFRSSTVNRALLFADRLRARLRRVRSIPSRRPSEASSPSPLAAPTASA